MLTRFVRAQLVIFAVASVIGIVAMALVYMQLPTLAGIGRIVVKVEMPATGGLYRFSNVTLRGVQIGKVTQMDLEPTKAVATLSLASSPRVPADVRAEVRSVSAVGEQFIDLVPRGSGGPYLQDGSVIREADVDLPQQVGPVLDQVSGLLATVPRDRLGSLLDETYQGLAEAGYDLGSLFDSSSVLSGEFADGAAETRALIDESVPLLDGQMQSSDSLRTWARSLAGITEQLVQNDPDIRTLLNTGQGFTQEVSALLEQIRPTLPVLLANLTSIGQVTVTYRPSIEQLLVLTPLTASGIQSYAMPRNNPTGIALSDFGISIGDPPVCTVGFLPPSQWRSPADETEIDTPDGLYCKLPQDSPISVRGARNAPCLEHPGKRAPTVEICNSDMPYQPLAMRQHVLGPNPIDPNLIAQGIPPDGRVTEGEHLYAPIEGTPLPPGATPTAPDPAVPEGVPAAPASIAIPGEQSASVAVAPYNIATGQYLTPDGTVGSQPDLIDHAASWEDLLPR